MSLLLHLENLVIEWVKANCPQAAPQGNFVTACQDEKFGHFQTNAAMISAKILKKNPRELGQTLADFCAKDFSLKKPQVAGPGFVNFTFKNSAILEAFGEILNDPHLGVAQAKHPLAYVVDFSSPNVAKSMHVGHIRSTILGWSITQTLRALGHTVITDNHLGDWGTQFGKIILGYKRAGCPEWNPENAIAQMEKIYQETHQACEKDDALLEQARQELLKLQSGDKENNRLWHLFIDDSRKEFDAIYARLGVAFDYTLGESFYNPWLKETVEDLRKKKIAEESQGATAIFFSGIKELEDKPFLIEKSDGAALYATTDLATVRYRAKEFKLDGIIYVTDGRQQLHFAQLFNAARRWGYDKIKFEHVWFGSILGKDKKPLKTREGTPIKLKELLDEAESRSLAILKEKRPDLAPGKATLLARVIGIGALKYADLMQNRNLDYVFDWDKLLAFEGNTAPYLINAYVRTRSILRKADAEPQPLPLVGEHALDFDLMRKLMDFGDVVTLTAQELRPHYICTYLYELASLFHRFFENCPVLKASSENLKNTRLQLCQTTGSILQKGLFLLGIETVEEM
ncbi:MAG: arginine--tRNA ligase [Verrucomicrobiota bacterium]